MYIYIHLLRGFCSEDFDRSFPCQDLTFQFPNLTLETVVFDGSQMLKFDASRVALDCAEMLKFNPCV